MKALRCFAPCRKHAALAAWMLLLLCLNFGLVAPRPVVRRHRFQPKITTEPTALATLQLRHLTQQDASNFGSAPSCLTLPTASSSTPDQNGRLWGWHDNATCAFKDIAGHALFYVDYEPGDWLHIQPCSIPAFPEDSVADSRLKVWGWEVDGTLCAFKDDRQHPVPMVNDHPQQTLPWADVPACSAQSIPTLQNAVPDSNGCLWGWQVERNCAFKNSTTNQPLYYSGYKFVCNTTANDLEAAGNQTRKLPSGAGEVIRAAEQSLEVVIQQTPGMFTDLGVIGQRSREKGYGDESEAAHGGIISASEAIQSDAPLTTVSMVAVDFGEGPALRSSFGNHRRRLASSEADPRFPKSVASSCSGGLDTVTSPGHGSKGRAYDDPCLPETKLLDQITAAEGGSVTYPPVAYVPDADKRGIGGFTPPVSVGAMGVPFGVHTLQPGFIQAAEGGDVPAAILGPGHSFEALEYPKVQQMRQDMTRRHLLQSVARAQAFSSASSQGRGTATSAAVARAPSSQAVAVSCAADNGSASSTAVATDGQQASAVVDATARGNKTSCVLSVTVINNKVSWHCANAEVNQTQAPKPLLHNDSTIEAPDAASGISSNESVPIVDPLAPTWHDTGACDVAPNKTNSVQDAMGRLWGYDPNEQQPCAYKSADGKSLIFAGYIQVKWATAPACAAVPTATNSMADAEGRLWGWDAAFEDNCAFKDPSSGNPVSITVGPPVAGQIAVDNGPQLSPSAAGPGNATNATHTGNNTANLTVEALVGVSDTHTLPASILGQPRNNSSLAEEASTQAQSITHSLAPNATHQEVALASAKAAIIYQRASDAETVSTNQNPASMEIKTAELDGTLAHSTPSNAGRIPAVLLSALVNQHAGSAQANSASGTAQIG